jgi:hypothetical protein
MAIYSLHHSSIGKSTQAHSYTAAAHIAYITRANALTRTESGRMPLDGALAASFVRAAEDRDRKNARVIDKVLLALPRELDGIQRAELVRAFAEDVTRAEASWLAAFHETGKDAANPHVHLVIRDRSCKTGKRVAFLSEKGSTERLRLLWEEHANRALSRARRHERIDRRSLKARGLRRKATIHEGVRARQLDKKCVRPQSRQRIVRNAALARSSSRIVDYARLDAGISRVVANGKIRRTNAEQAKVYWQELDSWDRDQEIQRLRAIHLPDLMREDGIGPQYRER